MIVSYDGKKPIFDTSIEVSIAFLEEIRSLESQLEACIAERDKLQKQQEKNL